LEGQKVAILRQTRLQVLKISILPVTNYSKLGDFQSQILYLKKFQTEQTFPKGKKLGEGNNKCDDATIHRGPKKRATLLLSISSPIIDQFSKLFH